MTKFGRDRLRGRPLSSDCYRAYSSGVEFYDDKGNGYCGCYGLTHDQENYRHECLECGALAWAITNEDMQRAIRGVKVVN